MSLRLTVPPLTRALLAALVLTSAAYQLAAYQQHHPATGIGLLNPSKSTIVPYISLTPQSQSLLKHPWTAATATFAEQNLFTLAAAAAALFVGARYLERAWGGAELARFVALLVLAPNVLAAVLYALAYQVSGGRHLLYVTSLSTLHIPSPPVQVSRPVTC